MSEFLTFEIINTKLKSKNFDNRVIISRHFLAKADKVTCSGFSDVNTCYFSDMSMMKKCNIFGICSCHQIKDVTVGSERL